MPKRCFIDRHYNSLALYRSQSPSMYAVHACNALHLCFLELEGNRLILRPRNHQVPVRLIEVAASNRRITLWAAFATFFLNFEKHFRGMPFAELFLTISHSQA